MELCDYGVEALILAASEENTDCFFTPDVFPSADDIIRFAVETKLNTAVIMSGKGIVDDSIVPNRKKPYVKFFPSTALYDPDLPEVFDGLQMKELVVLNAELAISTEYGFLRDYTRIGDLRACMHNTLHVTGIFSGAECEFGDDYPIFFGNEKAVKAGGANIKFESELFNDDRAKFRGVIEKITDVKKNTAVICTTRREAYALSKEAERHGIQNFLFDGGIRDSAKTNIISECRKSDNICIIATKSLLQYAPVLPPLDVLYCGIPYSVSHASRVTVLTHSAERILKCCFCPTDIRLSQKLSQSYAEQFADDIDAFIDKRNAELIKVLRIII